MNRSCTTHRARRVSVSIVTLAVLFATLVNGQLFLSTTWANGTSCYTASPDPGRREQYSAWGIIFFDESAKQCCQTAGIGGLLTGDAQKNKEALLQFFTSHGMTLAQAAGIAGNVQQESTFSTTAQNPRNSAYGLFQWLGDRYTNLVNYAQSQKLDVSDANVQLNFAWLEINGPEKATLLEFASRPTMTPEEAAVAWSVKFERANASESMDTNRAAFARSIFSEFSGKIQDGKGLDTSRLNTGSAESSFASGISNCVNTSTTTCTPHAAIGDTLKAEDHAAIFGKYQDQSGWVPIKTFMDFTFSDGSAANGGLVNKKVEPCLRAVEAELKTQSINYPVRSFMCSRISSGDEPTKYHGYAAACDINPSKTLPGNSCGYCAGWGTNNHDIPDSWVATFEKYGWTWGGRWKNGNGDWMHFQYEGDEADKSKIGK